MFDEILNVTISEEKVSITGVTQENVKLLLRRSSPDSHETQIQEDETLDWPHALISLKENSRQGKKRVTNIRPAAHKGGMVKCSPCDPEF